MPVALSSIPKQSTPSYVPFFTAQMAALIAFWSPVPSATKSGYPCPYHSAMKGDPTCGRVRKRDVEVAMES